MKYIFIALISLILLMGGASAASVYDNGSFMEDANTIHLWRFNEGTGSVSYNEVSGSSNLALTDVEMWETPDYFGSYGINTTLNRAYQGSSVSPGIPDEGSVEIWITPVYEWNSTSVLSEKSLVSWNYINIKLQTDGTIKTNVNDGTTDHIVYTTQSTWKKDTPYKISLTWSTLNGVAVWSNTTSTTAVGEYDGTIGLSDSTIGIGGARSSNIQQTPGLISEIRISDIDRTPIELFGEETPESWSLQILSDTPTNPDNLTTFRTYNYSDGLENVNISYNITGSIVDVDDTLYFGYQNQTELINVTAVSGLNWFNGTVAEIPADTYMIWSNTVVFAISNPLPATDPTTTLGESQTFSLNTSTFANITWYLDSIEQQTNTSVTYAELTLIGGTAGEYNVTAIADDGSTEVSKTWAWTVTETPVTPTDDWYTNSKTSMIDDIDSSLQLAGVILIVLGGVAILGILAAVMKYELDTTVAIGAIVLIIISGAVLIIGLMMISGMVDAMP